MLLLKVHEHVAEIGAARVVRLHDAARARTLARTAPHEPANDKKHELCFFAAFTTSCGSAAAHAGRGLARGGDGGAGACVTREAPAGARDGGALRRVRFPRLPAIV